MKRIAALAAVLTLTACTPTQLMRWVTARDAAAATADPADDAQVKAAVDAYLATKAAYTAGRHCEQWYDTAIEAGWLPQEWPDLSIIMWTESMCIPTADSSRSSARGLTQILDDWLGACGLTYAQLHDPYENLKCASLIYHHGGGRRNWSHFSSSF